jgi:site-specific recombinase XerD
MANNDFETFREHLVGLELSERTIKGYLADLKIFTRWFEQTNEEELSPHSLTPTDIREYKQYLLVVKKAKANTINRHLSALRAYGNWAKVAGVISCNPVDGIKSIDQQSHAPKWLDRKQQAAIIREAELRVQSAKTEPGKRQAIRDHCVLIVLLNTGLRVSELVALEMTDISLSERKGELRVRLGKGTKQRVVPVNDTARKALKACYEVRADIKTQRVFITQRGPATVRAIQSILEDLGKDTHIEKMTPHMARHSFAKNLVNSGVTLEKVAMLLGHSSLNTTMVYTTPGMSDLDRAVRVLDG